MECQILVYLQKITLLGWSVDVKVSGLDHNGIVPLPDNLSIGIFICHDHPCRTWIIKAYFLITLLKY